MNTRFALSQDKKEKILSDFPNLKLSYENIIYKKVYNADSYLAIPCGIKCFAWFTIYQDKNMCFIMELTENKQVTNITIANTCFSSNLSYGTILYGTLVNNDKNRYFSVEDIFQYKGTMIERENWGNKYILLKNLFKENIKQVAYNNSFLIFGLPIMTSNIDILMQKMENSKCKYKVETIQFRSFYRSNNYLYIPYKNFIENRPIKPNNIYEKRVEEKPSIMPIQNLIQKQSFIQTENNSINMKKKKEIEESIFIVKPDIQNDIYHLYSINNQGIREYHSIACIPDYKCSVMMNSLFRIIKENNNLDALEESDDEEEFQDERDDRFVHLEKEYKMLCKFNSKFKKWYPVKVM
jgi:hypothetical protein